MTGFMTKVGVGRGHDHPVATVDDAQRILVRDIALEPLNRRLGERGSLTDRDGRRCPVADRNRGRDSALGVVSAEKHAVDTPCQA